jgi:hypothetical protein
MLRGCLSHRILASTGLLASARAHSWYPHDCCSNQDCMAADGIRTEADGDEQVTVGDVHIAIPRGFVWRPSADHRVHICFRTDETRIPVPVCLFLPSEV